MKEREEGIYNTENPEKKLNADGRKEKRKLEKEEVVLADGMHTSKLKMKTHGDASSCEEQVGGATKCYSIWNTFSITAIARWLHTNAIILTFQSFFLESSRGIG